MTIKSIEFLRGILIKEQGVVKIKSDFLIKDIEHIVELVSDIERVVQLFPQLSNDKGYINNPSINIPLIEFVIREIMLVSKKDSEYYINAHTSHVYSILMNKIVYYMVMLLMLMLVYKIED
jgi:hypothetical protein